MIASKQEINSQKTENRERRTAKPKTMSLKQLAANRRNALKSTGPRTTDGKAKSKLNALKHGILSREVVVRGLHIKESPRELAELRARFCDELQPVGPLEEMLVDQIVTAYWRLRRALTAETGEITLSVDGGQHERSRPDRLALQVQLAALTGTGDAAHKMKESVLGLSCLRLTLLKVRMMVEKDGELTDAALQETHFIGKPSSLTKQLAELRAVQVENPDGVDEATLKAKRREQILTAIDRQLNHYDWQQREATEREEAEESAHQAAAHLPSAQTLDKILRYETTLERQLYRAMNQLERLQRRRNGENIPPPMSMDIGSR